MWCTWELTHTAQHYLHLSLTSIKSHSPTMSFWNLTWEGLKKLQLQHLIGTNLHQLKCLSLHFCSHNTAKDSIFYSYTRHINGFAATLEEEVAAEIASKNHISSFFFLFSVFPFSLYEPTLLLQTCL